MKSAHSTSEGREAITEIAITHTRITQSGTRFFQFTSLKLQNGTFETMVTPANTATIHVRMASQPVGVKPKSTSTQTRPVISVSTATPPSAVKSRAISCTQAGPHGSAGSAALRSARSKRRSHAAVSPSIPSPAIEMKSQSDAPTSPMPASAKIGTVRTVPIFTREPAHRAPRRCRRPKALGDPSPGRRGWPVPRRRSSRRRRWGGAESGDRGSTSAGFRSGSEVPDAARHQRGAEQDHDHPGELQVEDSPEGAELRGRHRRDRALLQRRLPRQELDGGGDRGGHEQEHPQQDDQQ